MPVCRLPPESSVELAPSGAPGVTTSTEVIVVLAPPGRVDVNVDVLGGRVVLELGVVDVAKVESVVLVSWVGVDDDVESVDELIEVVDVVSVDVGGAVDVS